MEKGRFYPPPTHPPRHPPTLTTFLLFVFFLVCFFVFVFCFFPPSGQISLWWFSHRSDGGHLSRPNAAVLCLLTDNKPTAARTHTAVRKTTGDGQVYRLSRAPQPREDQGRGVGGLEWEVRVGVREGLPVTRGFDLFLFCFVFPPLSSDAPV